MKAVKRKKKWQVIALNDSGKIISLGGLKKFFFTNFFFLLLILAAGAWGGLQYKEKTVEVKRLNQHLNAALMHTKSIQAEMDVLMYHIMNADSLKALRTAVQEETHLSVVTDQSEECSEKAENTGISAESNVDDKEDATITEE